MTWSKVDGPLRQGDICVVSGYPLWDIERSQRQVGSNDVTQSYVMPRHKAMEWDSLSGRIALAICSHDCDVENPRSRTGILVAPLVAVPAKPDSEMYAAIMSSGDTSTSLNYLNLFPVESVDEARTINAVIDFSAMNSYAKAEKVIPKLLEARVLGCDEDTRAAMGKKLALFFGRPYQEPRSRTDSPAPEAV